MGADFSGIFQSGFAIVIMIAFFGGSIFIHELGHFLAARWRGLKILRFSIGFGPKLFSWEGKDGCEYRVSLLPFGGYVALPQLADMGRLEGGSSEESKLLKESKDLPKISYFDKVVVSGAGAFFNVLFALVIAVVVWIVGVPVSVSNTETTVGYVPQKIFVGLDEIDSPAYLAGIKEGDKILSIDSTKISEFSEILEAVAVGTGRDKSGKAQCKIKLLRDGKELEVLVNPVLIPTNVRSQDFVRMIGIFPQNSLKIAEVMQNSPAEKAGLKSGDVLLKIDGKNFYSNSQVGDYLTKVSKGKTVVLSILRDGKNLELKATPQKIILSKPSVKIASKDSVLMSLFCQNYKEDEAFSTSANGTLTVLEVDTFNPISEGLKVGQAVLKVSSKDVSSISGFTKIFNYQPNLAGAKLTLSDMRGLGFKEVSIPSEFKAYEVEAQSKYMLGYTVIDERIIAHPSVARQFKDNVWRTWVALKGLVSPSSDIGLRHLSGPIGIGRVMYKFSLMDFSLVLSFVVLININLAILNMLPIPVLDGGHIMFATISKIMRRPLPISVVASLQGVFMMLFLGVMIFVVYCDIIRWNGDNAEDDMSRAIESFFIKDVNFK